jgi:hypothetical protein
MRLASIVALLSVVAAACSAPPEQTLNAGGGKRTQGSATPDDTGGAEATNPPDHSSPTPGNGAPSEENDDAGSPAPVTPNADAGADANADAASLPSLTECTTAPSVDRLEKWLASGEGTTVPATGSILVKDGTRYVAKVDFVNAEWHVVPVWMANKFDGGDVDLSKSTSITLTYSATADLYVQLRPGFAWSGGDKYLTKIPSTGGQVQTKVIPLAAASWTTLPELGAPAYPFADAVKQTRGLVFVGKTANKIAFYGLRTDGYVPPCL